MKIVLFILLTTCYLLLVHPVSAHVLKSSGYVGAVLHVSPEDDPIAKEPSSFFFEFKDKQQKFKPENCNCIVSISQGGKEIFSQELFQSDTNPSLDNASFTYTFPEKNIYKITVLGTPISPNAFEPFTLEYAMRVDRESTEQPVQPTDSISGWFKGHILHLIAAVIILTVVIVGTIKQTIEKSKVQKIHK